MHYHTWFLLFLLTSFISTTFAVEVPIYDFPLQAYSQDINLYLSPKSEDYRQPLIKPEYQKAQLQQFIRHYYSSDAQGLSPWSQNLVQSVLPRVQAIEQGIVDDFDNQKQEPKNYHYGENFKEHDKHWLNKIITTMNLNAFDQTFNSQNKAIIVQNTFVRALPYHAPDFFHLSIAGQGFPFDNLQESALWTGTPVYVLHRSTDKAWSLVLTPDAYFGWVKSSDLAYASTDFITQWQSKVHDGLMAITQTETSVLDQNNQFIFTAYIGTVLPRAQKTDNSTTLFIPLKNKQQQAVVGLGKVEPKTAQLMPIPATKQHLARLIKQLQNRPYGWGGAFLFNDCSQELKSLFTPFGIWLPRNSAQQAQYTSLDLSAKSMEERINTLLTKGHPLMTIVYIGGHVLLYLGNQQGSDHELIPITYQNVWGLAPVSKDRRYVIGQSVLLPLLKYYPEYPDAKSLANSTYFKLIFLDELTNQNESPQHFVNQFTKNDSVREL